VRIIAWSGLVFCACLPRPTTGQARCFASRTPKIRGNGCRTRSMVASIATGPGGGTVIIPEARKKGPAGVIPAPRTRHAGSSTASGRAVTWPFEGPSVKFARASLHSAAYFVRTTSGKESERSSWMETASSGSKLVRRASAGRSDRRGVDLAIGSRTIEFQPGGGDRC
jgi:hypothetical protein